MADKKVVIINNTNSGSKTFNNTTNVSRGLSGRGKFLSPISSGSKRLGGVFFNIAGSGLTVFRIVFLILLIGSFVRIMYGESNGLSFTTLLNGASEMKGIPTDWINTLSFKIRDGLLAKDSTTLIGKNILQLVSNLLLPLPTILYIIIGVLNVIWYITSFFTLVFGGLMI